MVIPQLSKMESDFHLLLKKEISGKKFNFFILLKTLLWNLENDPPFDIGASKT